MNRGEKREVLEIMNESNKVIDRKKDGWWGVYYGL